MGTDNKLTEGASPYQGRRVAHSAVKHCPMRLHPGCWKIFSQLCAQCSIIVGGFHATLRVKTKKKKQVCICVQFCICVPERKRGEQQMKVFFSSVHICKPLAGFYSSCLFIVNRTGLCFKAVAERWGFQGLHLLCVSMACHGREKKNWHLHDSGIWSRHV